MGAVNDCMDDNEQIKLNTDKAQLLVLLSKFRSHIPHDTKYMIFTGWEVRAKKYFVKVLRDVFETKTKYFSSTRRPKR